MKAIIMHKHFNSIRKLNIATIVFELIFILFVIMIIVFILEGYIMTTDNIQIWEKEWIPIYKTFQLLTILTSLIIIPMWLTEIICILVYRPKTPTKYQKQLLIFAILMIFFTIFINLAIIQLLNKLSDEKNYESVPMNLSKEKSLSSLNYTESKISNLDKLQKLHQLKQSGAISEEEYNRLKDKALNDEMHGLK